MTMGSLQGIRVVDLTANVAGPLASRVLGDLGAEVIKIERPGAGDDARGWRPSWEGQGIMFLDLNRNKRSVVVDIADPEQVERLAELIGTADVLVANLRPGILAGLGLGPEELLARHPRLVYAEITGFGTEGPRAGEPAFEPLIQAYSGLMSMTGEAGGDPARIPVSLLDRGSAMWAIIGILDALRSRDLTGKGGIVRTSLLETAIAWESTQLLSHKVTGAVPGPMGSRYEGITPHQAYPTADGHVMISAPNDRLFAKTCEALDAPELIDDPRFVGSGERGDNQEALTDELIRRLRSFTTAEATRRLVALGVPAGPVLDLGQAWQEEQVQAVGMVQDFPHPDIDGFQVVRLPFTTTNGTPGPDLPPPELGEGTDELLPKR
jgi:crotonobetainyl-CoA:carnitine CoA-transferase CaiB-like acyl-CoA transferase